MEQLQKDAMTERDTAAEKIVDRLNELLAENYETTLAHSYNESLTEMIIAALADERRKAADAVPTSWLDPILTGPDAVVGRPPWGCPEVERILQAVKQRIEAATTRQEG